MADGLYLQNNMRKSDFLVYHICLLNDSLRYMCDLKSTYITKTENSIVIDPD